MLLNENYNDSVEKKVLYGWHVSIVSNNVLKKVCIKSNNHNCFGVEKSFRVKNYDFFSEKGIDISQNLNLISNDKWFKFIFNKYEKRFR